MKFDIHKIIKHTIWLLFLCIVLGTGLFIYNAEHDYNINRDFTSISLNYDPNNNLSTYKWNDIVVSANNAFVKGVQVERSLKSLVIRALSPLPSLSFQNTSNTTQIISVNLENINLDYYLAHTNILPLPVKLTVNTLSLSLTINAGETYQIIPTEPTIRDTDKFVVLGDSRDGYETFWDIINQINAINPIFVINNGDLVFSGKPNQYRIYDHMVKKVSTNFLMTLGNHDIRGEGRALYTELYGPAYYSFDFGNNHFIFLDSSRGFAEAQAITDEEYTWLESDLQKSVGKKIFVVSHIPSTDPRQNVEPNDIQTYIDQAIQTGGSIESVLYSYVDNMIYAHGFRTTEEVQRFETLMTTYNVDTVYESHIHSYIDFTKNGVRYVISGGGGAELLNTNSFYHYLVAKVSSPDTLTVVELPSPANLLWARYTTTISLFAEAMFIENKLSVILFMTAFFLMIMLIVIFIYIRFKKRATPLLSALKESASFFIKDYRKKRKEKKANRKNKQ